MRSKRAPAALTNGASGSGNGPLLLVVEDEFLLALDLQDRLVDMGCRVLGPAPTINAADGLLDHTTPDAALLDVNLNGALVTPIAERLLDEAIPYLVATAYPTFASDPPALADAPRLTKPLQDQALKRALSELLRQQRQ